MRKLLAGAACGGLLLLLFNPIDAAADKREKTPVPTPTAAQLTSLLSTFDTYNRAKLIPDQELAKALRRDLLNSQGDLTAKDPKHAQKDLQQFADTLTDQLDTHAGNDNKQHGDDQQPINQSSAQTLLAMAQGAPPPTQFTLAPSPTAPITVATVVTTTAGTTTTSAPVVVTVPPATNVSALTVTAPPPNTPLPTPPPGGATLVATQVTATYTTGSSLNAPATLTSTFTPPPGINPLSAAIYTLDATGKTQKLASTVTKNSDGTYTVTATTPHFTPFITMGSAPTITSIAPVYGPQAGGTTVDINGAGLTGATAVTFNGVNATSFTPDAANLDGHLTAVAPVGTAGPAIHVQVAAPGGTSAATANDQFTYYAPIAATATLTAPATVYMSDTATFGGSATGGYPPGTYTWLWTFDDGTTSTAQNPTHTFPSIGSFTETLTATDAIGKTATSTVVVTVVLPTISGTVSSAGLPVGGVTVSAWNCVQVPGDGCSSLTEVVLPAGSGLATTTTQADGRYSLPVPNGAFRISFGQTATAVEQWYPGVYRAGKGTDVPVNGAPVTGISGSLPAGHQVSGKITDGTNPIPGVFVVASTNIPTCCGPGPYTVDDTTGGYALTLPDGTWNLGVSPPPGWLPQASTVTMAGAVQPNTNVTLTAGDIISGIVSFNSAPLPNVNVQALNGSGNLAANNGFTDQKGFYQVTVPKTAGSVELLFQPSAGTTAAPQWYPAVNSFTQATAVAHPQANVNITLPAGFHITGTVTNGSTPLAGIPVDAADPASVGKCCFGGTASTQTDASGSYSMVVPAGSWLVQFNGNQSQKYVGQWWQGATSPNTAAPVNVSADTPNISATLQPGFYVSGTVTGTGGAKLGGILVKASSATCCAFFDKAVTNPDGTYQILLPNGSYVIGFNFDERQGYLPQFYSGALTQAGATTVNVNGADLGSVNAALQTGLPISGTVLGTGSMPLGGIDVSVNDANGGKGSFGAFTQTRPDGTYTALVPPGTYIVQFNPNEQQGYLPQFWNNVSTPDQATKVPVTATGVTGISATLQAGFAISGKITDATGAAVPNGPVIATPSCAKGCFQNAFNTQSNPDGTYTVLVANGTYIVGAAPTFNSMNTWYGGTANQTLATPVPVTGTPVTGVNIQLLPTFRVSGTVALQGGGPAANVVVGLNGYFPDGTCCWGAGDSQTDASGNYSFSAANGTYNIQVNGPSGYLDGQANVTVSGAPVTQNFTLATGFIVRGIITAGGTPAGGVNLSFGFANPDGSCCAGFANGAQTDPGGNYSVTLANGTYWLNVNPPPGFVQANLQVIVNGANQTVGVDLKPGFAVSGHVTNASNQAIANVNVNISSPNPDGSCCGPFAGGTQTDSNGNYGIVVANGTYFIGFNPPSGYVTPQPTLITVAGGPITQNATLQAGFTVSGKITAGGAGAGGVDVGYNLPNAQGMCCAGFAGGTQTNPDGSYSVTLGNGTYLMFVGFQHAPAGFVRVQTTATVNNANLTLNVDLPAGFAVSGTVSNPSSASIPNAPVNFNPAKPDGSCCAPGGFGVQTDAGGRYSVTVTPGSWYAFFGPTSAYAQYQTTINVTANATLNATLQPGFAIHGTVKRTGGVPLAGVNVNVSLPDATGRCCGAFVGGVQTDANGNYSILVANGTYLVGFFPQPGYFQPQPVSVTVSNAAYQLDTTLQAGLIVSGHVTDAAGAPVNNVRINAFSTAPGTPGYGANTNANGDYQLTVPGGTWHLGFEAPNAAGLATQFYDGTAGGTSLPSSSTGLLVNASTTVNVTLQAGFTITGTVTNTAPAGIAGIRVHGTDPANADLCCYPDVGNTQTDSAGNYSLVVPSGKWAVQFDSNGTYVGQVYNGAPDTNRATLVTAPATGVNAALQNGYTISGTVTDAGGASLGGVNIGICSANPNVDGCIAGLPGVTTRSDGTYSLLEPNGSYELFFQTPSSPTQKVFVTVSGASQTVNLTMQQTFVISGHVTDASGAPVAGVGVQVSSATGGCCTDGTATDVNGNYQVAVPDGNWKIWFLPSVPSGLAPQWYSAASSGAAATVIPVNGANAPNINATLQPGFAVTGTVTDSVTGAPVGDVYVFADDLGRGHTRSDGTYTMILPNGTYTVNFSPPVEPTGHVGASYAGSITVSNTPVGGISAALQPGYEVSGQVTDSITGAPISGVNIGANPGPGGATTNATGNYALMFPAGSTQTLFFTPPPPYQPASTPATPITGPTTINQKLVHT